MGAVSVKSLSCYGFIRIGWNWSARGTPVIPDILKEVWNLQEDHLYVHGTGEFGFDPTNTYYACALWAWSADVPDVSWLRGCGEENTGDYG